MDQFYKRKMNPLTLIKIIHTIIWLFFNVVIFYLLYAAIVNKIDIWVWVLCYSKVWYYLFLKNYAR
jgi:hypothetical protein